MSISFPFTFACSFFPVISFDGEQVNSIPSRGDIDYSFGTCRSTINADQNNSETRFQRHILQKVSLYKQEKRTITVNKKIRFPSSACISIWRINRSIYSTSGIYWSNSGILISHITTLPITTPCINYHITTEYNCMLFLIALHHKRLL